VAYDNPELIVACVIGDGEAETEPMATSWHSNKFLNPESDGVVLPILHLNGYKIANPCFLARISHELKMKAFFGAMRPRSRAEGCYAEELSLRHKLVTKSGSNVRDIQSSVRRAR
jgi:xylulose-5-phosphate/fructose-6-phosphate phosphoketolase